MKLCSEKSCKVVSTARTAFADVLADAVRRRGRGHLRWIAKQFRVDLGGGIPAGPANKHFAVHLLPFDHRSGAKPQLAADGGRN